MQAVVCDRCAKTIKHSDAYVRMLNRNFIVGSEEMVGPDGYFAKNDLCEECWVDIERALRWRS